MTFLPHIGMKGSSQKRIQNRVKHVRRSILQK